MTLKKISYNFYNFTVIITSQVNKLETLDKASCGTVD